jgi:hypothetical protein
MTWTGQWRAESDACTRYRGCVLRRQREISALVTAYFSYSCSVLEMIPCHSLTILDGTVSNTTRLWQLVMWRVVMNGFKPETAGWSRLNTKMGATCILLSYLDLFCKAMWNCAANLDSDIITCLLIEAERDCVVTPLTTCQKGAVQIIPKGFYNFRFKSKEA